MLKYPKVGTENPTVRLSVWNLFEDVLKPVTPPKEVLEFDEHIYTAATWITEDELSIIWVNRVQNESSVSSCKEKSETWECVSVTNPSQVRVKNKQKTLCRVAQLCLAQHHINVSNFRIILCIWALLCPLLR